MTLRPFCVEKFDSVGTGLALAEWGHASESPFLEAPLTFKES